MVQVELTEEVHEEVKIKAFLKNMSMKYYVDNLLRKQFGMAESPIENRLRFD